MTLSNRVFRHHSGLSDQTDSFVGSGARVVPSGMCGMHAACCGQELVHYMCCIVLELTDLVIANAVKGSILNVGYMYFAIYVKSRKLGAFRGIVTGWDSGSSARL